VKADISPNRRYRGLSGRRHHAIALFAAFVNGALGYGFSSLTVPLALVFYTNRVLNPAIVIIEVLLNLYVLFINRDGVPAVLRRVFPIIIGLLPGIGVGAFVLASLQPDWVKFGTYTVILPLILIQAAGMAQTNSVAMAGRSAFWNGAGYSVFGNDNLWPPLGDFVQ